MAMFISEISQGSVPVVRPFLFLGEYNTMCPHLHLRSFQPDSPLSRFSFSLWACSYFARGGGGRLIDQANHTYRFSRAIAQQKSMHMICFAEQSLPSRSINMSFRCLSEFRSMSFSFRENLFSSNLICAPIAASHVAAHSWNGFYSPFLFYLLCTSFEADSHVPNINAFSC